MNTSYYSVNWRHCELKNTTAQVERQPSHNYFHIQVKATVQIFVQNPGKAINSAAENCDSVSEH